MLAVLDGTPVQLSGTGVLLPRQVYLAGIVAPSANAGLRTEIADGLADVAGLAGVPWVPGVAVGAD
ncbi:MAG TPA: hypothetical protein VE733_04305 [Streptosporangiaceae bacterium]|jgi:hypothetical protein|nr:hypothetical protein [Streptosporangiaceae bacterium]